MGTFDDAIKALKFLNTRTAARYTSKGVYEALSNERAENFIQGLDKFLANTIRATTNEQMVYLELLSRRDYLSFKLFGTTTLDTCYCFGFDITKLERNRLLTISGDKVHFKYEA